MEMFMRVRFIESFRTLNFSLERLCGPFVLLMLNLLNCSFGSESFLISDRNTGHVDQIPEFDKGTVGAN